MYGKARLLETAGQEVLKQEFQHNLNKDTKMSDCGHCHQCGTSLHTVLDGEEWCSECGEYRRYRSHGWVAPSSPDSHDNTPCLPPAMIVLIRESEDGAKEKR